jgi:hypothetical protein
VSHYNSSLSLKLDAGSNKIFIGMPIIPNYKPMKFLLSFVVATQTEGCKFNLDLACSILELEFYNLNDGSKAY